ncbi:BNR-4 repeat-containing protein [Paeniroseomonas aquatica]|uniref:BNR-4 repeat-containing protein n=1 Tax=Paeniroseomonas aquatica TaxID=373043 RepID=UPI003613BA4B
MPDQIIPLGEAWASSSVNCVAFRHDAIVPVTDGCVVSFYDADGNVVLQHLDRALVPQRRLTIACPIVPHDAHNCISLGVDSSGAVHAVFGAHSSIAYHVRVSPLLDGAAPEAVPLDGRPQMRFTYPTLLHDPGSGELRLLYREGGPWAGELRVKRWNDEAAAFIEDELPLLSGRLGQPTAGPYINRPVRLPDGRIALFCVWRLARDATTAGDVANTGLDLIVAAPDLRSLASLDGVGLTLPVTPVHAPRTWAVPVGANLINQVPRPVGWMAIRWR